VATLHIELGGSPRLTAGLATMHGFAAAMLGLSSLPSWLAGTTIVALAASLAFYLRREGLRLSPAAIVSVSLSADCRCEFLTRNGTRHEAALLGSSFVAPYLTVLNLRPAGARLARHVVIMPDAVGAEIFRTLRVLLRWRCGEK